MGVVDKVNNLSTYLFFNSVFLSLHFKWKILNGGTVAFTFIIIQIKYHLFQLLHFLHSKNARNTVIVRCSF